MGDKAEPCCYYLGQSLRVRGFVPFAVQFTTSRYNLVNIRSLTRKHKQMKRDVFTHQI